MNQTANENQSANWPALLIGLFLATGAVFMLMAAMLLVIIGLVSGSELRNAEPLSMYLLATGALLIGLMLLPGIYFNGRRFFGLPDLALRLPRLNDWLLIPILVGAWIMTLALGHLAASQTTLSTLILPIANVFAVCLPILLYLRLSLRGLDFPTARRGWSIWGTSMLITPSLALFFEAIVAGIIILLLYLYARTIPGLMETFSTLTASLTAGNASEAEITRVTASLLFAPGVSVAALSVFSIAIPLIEETFKLTAMWFYLGRIHRPADGFVLGVLCGAAFALAENIGFTSAGSADWAASIAARTTTALPHIFNSGLLGWALVSAWREHRFGRLLAAFFAVVLVHGAWNAISLGLAMSGFAEYVAEVPAILQSNAPWLAAWGLMVIGTLTGLIYCNSQMRKPSEDPPESSE
jgi:hypothetical protein